MTADAAAGCVCGLSCAGGAAVCVGLGGVADAVACLWAAESVDAGDARPLVGPLVGLL